MSKLKAAWLIWAGMTFGIVVGVNAENLFTIVVAIVGIPLMVLISITVNVMTWKALKKHES